MECLIDFDKFLLLSIILVSSQKEILTIVQVKSQEEILTIIL